MDWPISLEPEGMQEVGVRQPESGWFGELPSDGPTASRMIIMRFGGETYVRTPVLSDGKFHVVELTKADHQQAATAYIDGERF